LSLFVHPQVTKMKMISPSNREVDVGKTLSETEYIGMCFCMLSPKPCFLLPAFLQTSLQPPGDQDEDDQPQQQGGGRGPLGRALSLLF
jgi:hypothetical protein